MRYLSVLIFIVSVVTVSCKKEDNEPSNPFGIDYSAYEDADQASGFIIYQNYGGPRIDLSVDTAYLLELEEADNYQMCYFFTDDDSLKINLVKRTADYNYHSEADDSNNLIVLSVFNQDTLNMSPSALSLQPQTETNDFTIVLNLHTSDGKGTFNGTVEKVVLIAD